MLSWSLLDKMTALIMSFTIGSKPKERRMEQTKKNNYPSYSPDNNEGPAFWGANRTTSLQECENAGSFMDRDKSQIKLTCN